MRGWTKVQLAIVQSVDSVSRTSKSDSPSPLAMRTAPLASLFALTLCAGCAGVGARTVTADRFDYTTALSDSWSARC